MAFRLIPKDVKFFDLFVADGDNLALRALGDFPVFARTAVPRTARGRVMEEAFNVEDPHCAQNVVHGAASLDRFRHLAQMRRHVGIKSAPPRPSVMTLVSARPVMAASDVPWSPTNQVPRPVDVYPLLLDAGFQLSFAAVVALIACYERWAIRRPDPEPAIKLMDPRWSGALPATFLYNEKGEEVFKHYGRVDPAELRAAIEKLVKKGDVQ